MDNILKLLDEATDSGHAGPKEIAAAAELDPMMEKLNTLTSKPFSDRLWDLQGDILQEETDEHFARGFRLGAQIMLAALTGG